MTQYNNLNLKFSNSQKCYWFNFKSFIKCDWRFQWWETNFPHKLLLTDTQFFKLSKAFANGSSANLIFLIIQISNMVH